MILNETAEKYSGLANKIRPFIESDLLWPNEGGFQEGPNANVLGYLLSVNSYDTSVNEQHIFQRWVGRFMR